MKLQIEITRDIRKIYSCVEASRISISIWIMIMTNLTATNRIMIFMDNHGYECY